MTLTLAWVFWFGDLHGGDMCDDDTWKCWHRWWEFIDGYAGRCKTKLLSLKELFKAKRKWTSIFLNDWSHFQIEFFLSKLCNLGQYTFTLLIRNKMVFIIANVILIVIRIKVIAFIVVLIILRMILMPTRCLSHVCSSSSEQYLVSILLLFFFFKFVSVKVWLNWIFSSLYCWSSIWFSWIHT